MYEKMISKVVMSCKEPWGMCDVCWQSSFLPIKSVEASARNRIDCFLFGIPIIYRITSSFYPARDVTTVICLFGAPPSLADACRIRNEEPHESLKSTVQLYLFEWVHYFVDILHNKSKMEFSLEWLFNIALRDTASNWVNLWCYFSKAA